MAPSFFYPLPTIKDDRLEELYTVHGVDRAVVGDLASTSESPEAVRDGYGGAYLSFFETCSLLFPIPEPVLNILAELGLSLTQICPNFLRHLLAHLVKDREEGLLFGFDELRHLVLMKRNNQNPETFLMSPPAFLMSGGSGDAPEIAGVSEDEAGHSQEDEEASSSNTHLSDRLERQLARRSSFRTSTSALAGKADSGIPPIPTPHSDDEGSPKGSEIPCSFESRLAGQLCCCEPAKVLHLWAKTISFHLLVVRGPWIVALRLSLLLMRKGLCQSSRHELQAFNEFVVTMEDRVHALRNESEVEKGKVEVQRVTEELRTTKEEARKKTGEAMILRDEWKRARQEKVVFETEVATLRTKVVELEEARKKTKWVDKKKEVFAEIQLHEVVAKLDLLNEIKDEGLVVEDEIVRLKEMEKDCEVAASLAAVPDWSVAGLDLPQVSEDLIDDEAASSSAREEANS
ncbi:hypothetical protein DY000_02039812 [Brassica cretica]|uniref:Uncharacterized protein n=1 Tax=Brassica cretica TaxID=69181 RepID=A0ABQ7BHA2_BRACR|nr:hypothetical protein DY000_02039812 [Brassica cretica]